VNWSFGPRGFRVVAIEVLTRLVAPPRQPLCVPPDARHSTFGKAWGVRLPADYFQLVTTYGSGYFGHSTSTEVGFLNPYETTSCQRVLEFCHILRGHQEATGGRYIRHGTFPESPGLLPWGTDGHGQWLMWLTDGEPESWPIYLKRDGGWADSDEMWRMPVTTFLAKAFAREIVPCVWNGDWFFEPPEPVQFHPITESSSDRVETR
jgi:hypothetical protein